MALTELGSALPEKLPAKLAYQDLGHRFEGVQSKRSVGKSCPNRKHDNCRKSRSIKVDEKDFGPNGHIIYLQTWLSRAFTEEDRKAHSDWRPSAAEMRAFMT